jgi:hypothetical protein
VGIRGISLRNSILPPPPHLPSIDMLGGEPGDDE